MAFGAGVLISALSIDLMNEAFDKSHDPLSIGLSFVGGALVFVLGDYLIDKNGGHYRKRSHGIHISKSKEAQNPSDSSGTAILLGTLLDGIPESFVVGASIAIGGSTGMVFVVAVFLSNLPEGISGSIGMKMAGMSIKSIIILWLTTLAATTLSVMAGFTFLGHSSPLIHSAIMAFASGAILAMLCDTMIPEAFKFGGRFVALVTVLGFFLAFTLSKMF
jgi:ZIP family zinc transporter